MVGTIVKAVLLLAVPTLFFVAGAWAMKAFVGRDSVVLQWHHHAKPEDRKPLNERWTGYDADAVDRQWSALDDSHRKIEQHFLEVDLGFPIVYGTAIAIALMIVRAELQLSLHRFWFLLPVAFTAIADWTENTVLWLQLHRYYEAGKAGLQPSWIHIASTATILKLIAFTIATWLLLGLIVWMLARAFRNGRRPTTES